MRAVGDALITKIDLVTWDPDGETSVWIRQARQGQHARREALFAKTKVQRGDDGVTEVYEWPTELSRLECCLTFEDANIIGPDAKPMFRKGMAESEFNKAFDDLPPELAQEWHTAVRQVNRQWGWSGEEAAKN